MAGITNNEAMFQWVQDHLLHGGLVPGHKYNGQSVRTADDGSLIYVRTAAEGKMVPRIQKYSIWVKGKSERQGGHYEERERQIGDKRVGSRTAFGPVTLAVYVASSKTFLLNGNGFTDRSGTATTLQTTLRGMIQFPSLQIVRRWEQLNLTFKKNKKGDLFTTDEGHLRYVIVPFEALEGGDIDFHTVRPIDVTEDTWEPVITPVGKPPTLEEFMAVDPEQNHDDSTIRTRTVAKGNIAWRVMEMNHHVFIDPEGKDQPIENGLIRDKPIKHDFDRKDPDWYEGYEIRKGWKVERRWRLELNTWQWDGVMNTNPNHFQLETRVRHWRGGFNWSRPRQVTETRRKELPEQLDGLANGEWYASENVHQLGASLFSAVGEDGRRHKFVSAFDNFENPPMYFLAQLPDRSGATTFKQAIDALAPEIVHQALKDGRDVRRQGDIFAIETKLTDEAIYAMAHTRVRRAAALWAHNDDSIRNVIHGKSNPNRDAVEGETTERLQCPCGCGRSKIVPWGPTARRALSIYRTGHTATEVITTKNGTTYIRGIMHHDPQIEEPGRTMEHRDVGLGQTPKEFKRWFLCVRNRVPSKRRSEAAESE